MAGERYESAAGNRDFRRLWTGQVISQAGSAVGSTALPVVAVRVLHVSTFAVAFLAALSAIATLVFALPIGRWTEFHAKRPAMVAADGLRYAALLSVPVSYALHGLTSCSCVWLRC